MVKEVKEQTEHPEGLVLLSTKQETLEEKKKSLLNKMSDGLQLNGKEMREIKKELNDLIADSVELISAYSTKPDDGPIEKSLIKCETLIKCLSAVDKIDYEVIDEKFLEAIVNLDYVNRQFMAHINSEKNTKEDLKKLAKSINDQIAALPVKMFATKGLPHPLYANADSKVFLYLNIIHNT